MHPALLPPRPQSAFDRALQTDPWIQHNRPPVQYMYALPFLWLPLLSYLHSFSLFAMAAPSRTASTGKTKKRKKKIRESSAAKKKWAKPLTYADVKRLQRQHKTINKENKALFAKVSSLLKSKAKKTSAAAAASPATKAKTKQADEKPRKRRSEVYVLQPEGGYVYVGKTSCGIKRRLEQHMGVSSSSRFGGAAFTRLHRPTGRLLKRLGNLEGDGDGPERDETLRQMFKRGVQRVRGWRYVRAAPLRQDELEDIETNIRELFDLCRKCGRHGHFAAGCREAKDRHGRCLR